MPKETFWHPAASESADERKFSVAWGGEQPADAPVELGNVALDRSGINRLIRVLRNARDKTYGRDE